jgi:glycerol-3-phosphate dehydrogenase
MTEPSEEMDAAEVLDLIVIGGGVVGLSILREAAAIHGYKCALVEREADLLHWASGTNET